MDERDRRRYNDNERDYYTTTTASIAIREGEILATIVRRGADIPPTIVARRTIATAIVPKGRAIAPKGRLIATTGTATARTEITARATTTTRAIGRTRCTSRRGRDMTPSRLGTLRPTTKRRRGFSASAKKRDANVRNVIITYPRSYEDVSGIIDSLRSRQAIIVDFRRVAAKDTQRVLDFLSGALYALGGSQERIGDGMFLFTPEGVTIQGPLSLKRRYD